MFVALLVIENNRRKKQLQPAIVNEALFSDGITQPTFSIVIHGCDGKSLSCVAVSLVLVDRYFAIHKSIPIHIE